MLNLEARLKRSVRRGRVLTAPAQLAGYDADGLGYKTFRPDAVVIPADAEEIVAVLRDSHALGVPVTMRGAGTSLSGGPVAEQGGIVIHTSSLKAIRTIDRAGAWCEVECSVTLNQLDEALRPLGLFYPPDPSSGPVCTLGGNVAMNAGGAHCFRYGVTSNYILGLEAVLLDGSVQRFGGPAGGRGQWQADWKRLMVGSEGTLAAFTRFWLRTLPRAEKAWTFRATFPDLQAAERAIHALVADASFPVAIELMDPRFVAMVENSPMACGLPQDAFLIVTEIEGPTILVDARVDAVTQLMQRAGALQVDCSADESQRKKLWKARKVAGGLMGQISPDFLVQDAVIPKRALAELLQLVYDEADAAGLPAINVFHAGDGNLHPNFLFDARQPGELERVEAISKRLMQRVVAVGGTLSGEHGIGNDKAKYMPLVFGPDTLKLQLAVPAIFNPAHQLNPLKVFRGRKFLGAAVARNPTPDEHDEHALDAASGATLGPRLFVPFLDEIDGVMCVPAETTPATLTPQLTAHRLRFPLVFDPQVPLCEQVAASEYAPASSRFGPFCDNITGLNWRLPGGRVVRIGERVVKSTTGYDLLRFLLHSNHGLGTAIDYVLRLRPDCGQQGTFCLSGMAEAVRRAVAELLLSSWLNWFDSVDVLTLETADTLDLRITVNTRPEEWGVFESWLLACAQSHGLTVRAQTLGEPPYDGCPDLVLKTTPDRTLSLACELSQRHGLRCVALCYNGVVHGYCGPDQSPVALADRVRNVADRVRNVADRVRNVVVQYEQELQRVGGDWRSRHLPQPVPVGPEAQWLSILQKEFATS